jgi:iron complex outermembrane recepter protein
MTRMKTLACSVFLIFVGVAPVAADTNADAPKSLRMRARPPVGTRGSPVRWPKRVAQPATPDQPPPAPAGNDQPPGDGTTSPAADPAQPTPDQAPVPDQAPAPAAEPALPPTPPVTEQTPNLSDEELRKLAEQEAKEEVITVTGSTIERKTLTTPAPLTILNRDDLNASGRATVGDIIQQLPAQSNAINAQVNNGGDGSTRVDIRGLGAGRTLTLINGRRVVAGGTGANASVDLNSIPLAVIERVEVLKDGASAIYGSDAIGGVVNIITRTDFDGTEAALYTGGAQKGDGFTYDASFVTGHNSDNKRGNIIFSAGIQSQNPVFAGDRTYSKFDKDFDFENKEELIGGSPTSPGGRINTLAIDKNHDGKPNDAVDLCGMEAGKDAMGNPVMKPIQYCTFNAAGGYKPFTDADLYNFQPLNYLYTPSSRYNVYSAGTYKFRPEVSGFFEASYLNRTSDQQLAPEPLTLTAGLKVAETSIYNPYQADVLAYNRRLEEFGNRRFLQNVDTFRIVGGVQGSIPEDAAALKNWKWELSYNFGRTDGSQRNEGSLQKSHVANAIGPSFISATGVATCGTAAAPIAGCVPMDILHPSGSISSQARAYSTFTGLSAGFNEQQTVLAQAHGRVMKLPNNGDLSLAVGTDFRKESGGYTPDPVTAAGDTTGNAVTPTIGSYNVLEAFGEVSLVPISGKKYAEWVELNLAARAFKYETFGTGVTWKAGGLYRFGEGVSFRGTYSTAFRAPSVGDLFQGPRDGFPAVFDPCDTRPPGSTGPITLEEPAKTQCANQNVPANAVYNTRQQREITGGNNKLEAETANVITAGVVYEPPQVKGLSFTFDYWNIDITKAIQQLGASVIVSNCYTRNLPEYCELIHRSPQANYAIDYIDDSTLNVGGTQTSGLDFAAMYDHSFGKYGRFREQLEAQYLFKYNLDNEIQVIHGRDNYDLGVYPKYKANFSTSWSHKSGAGGGLNVRYVGSYRECENNDCNGGALARDVSAWYKLDLFGSYSLKSPAGKTTLSVGVNNLLNRAPSLIYIGFAGDSDASTYDYFGRFFYARMSQLF